MVIANWISDRGKRPLLEFAMASRAKFALEKLCELFFR
jgi:hypothetical protein